MNSLCNPQPLENARTIRIEVIENKIHFSSVFQIRSFYVTEGLQKNSARKGIIEIKNTFLIRDRESTCVFAYRLNVKTLLLFVFVMSDLFFGYFVEFLRVFHADDFLKIIFRGDE